MKSRWIGAIFFWVVLCGVGSAQQTITDMPHDYTFSMNGQRWGVVDNLNPVRSEAFDGDYRRYIFYGFGNSWSMKRSLAHRVGILGALAIIGFFGIRTFRQFKRTRAAHQKT